jgi:hypothetical protein
MESPGTLASKAVPPSIAAMAMLGRMRTMPAHGAEGYFTISLSLLQRAEGAQSLPSQPPLRPPFMDTVAPTPSILVTVWLSPLKATPEASASSCEPKERANLRRVGSGDGGNEQHARKGLYGPWLTADLLRRTGEAVLMCERAGAAPWDRGEGSSGAPATCGPGRDHVIGKVRHDPCRVLADELWGNYTLHPLHRVHELGQRI